MIDLKAKDSAWSRPLRLLLQSLIVVSVTSACGAQLRTSTADEVAQQSSDTQALSLSPVYNGRKYELITPTGERVMSAALQWQEEQVTESNAASYAQPAQCARNISKVLELAGLSRYRSPLVPELVDQIRASGGLVRRFPKSREGIARMIAKEFAGRLPTGALIAGCLYEGCGGNAGDGHVAVIGDINSVGALQLYHNNWYRPDNEGGVWKPHMIPLDWYQAGYRRKFMSTPWMDILRDPPRVGVPYDVTIELPAIDDLDPTNYFVTIAVPVEIQQEVEQRQGKVLDRDGNQVPMGSN